LSVDVEENNLCLVVGGMPASRIPLRDSQGSGNTIQVGL
jgi:hypothetical protein